MKGTVLKDVGLCSVVGCYVLKVFAPAIIRAMIEAASTSETSLNFYQTTRRNISEDSHLDDVKVSHKVALCGTK
jgi:hypothetical protein